MLKLVLRKDRRTGEPVRRKLVSAEKARKSDYIEIRAYDNKVKEMDRDSK